MVSEQTKFNTHWVRLLKKYLKEISLFKCASVDPLKSHSICGDVLEHKCYPQSSPQVSSFGAMSETSITTIAKNQFSLQTV